MRLKSVFKSVLYTGKGKETIVNIRVLECMSNKKIKSINNLISDPYSTKEHIKRADYQTFIQRQCTRQNIDY